MKHDIILAGVGGQGILAVAAIIANGARQKELYVKQSEVHGMAMRGGAVLAHLRLSDQPIHSDLIPRGGADLILSLEPVEALRHLEHLAPDGAVITHDKPVRNVPNYPDVEEVLQRIRRLPRHQVMDAEAVARDAGAARASNLVLVGAASPLLPVDADILEEGIRRRFASKGEKVVAINARAFRLGRESVLCSASASSQS